MIHYSRLLVLLASVGITASAFADFTETFSDPTQDTGHWFLSGYDSPNRKIQSDGGNLGGYLYDQVSSSVPTWQTVSTRYVPGIHDEDKSDSVFLGDYYDSNVTSLSFDLNVMQVGVWTPGRGITLELMGADDSGQDISYDATYTIPLSDDQAPTGWQHYDIPINAQGGAVPDGWTFTDLNNSSPDPSDWGTFLHRVDVAKIGLWQPMTGYPGLGVWGLGLDNVHIGAAQAVPEPKSFALLAGGLLLAFKRRRK